MKRSLYLLGWLGLLFCVFFPLSPRAFAQTETPEAVTETTPPPITCDDAKRYEAAELPALARQAYESVLTVNPQARCAIDPALRRALGEAGRARVRERFGWDSIVDRLEAVYRSAAERA